MNRQGEFVRLDSEAIVAARAVIDRAAAPLEELAALARPCFGRDEWRAHLPTGDAIRQARGAVDELDVRILDADSRRAFEDALDSIAALDTQDPRRSAAHAASILRKTVADLDPVEARMRELLDRDAGSWTPSEIAELRDLHGSAPQHLRSTAGHYTFQGGKYSFDDMLGWLATNHDDVDVSMTNRFAAAWRKHHDPTATRETITARVLEIFRRDASAWTSAEIGEVAASFNDLSKQLRPVGGPIALPELSYRPRLDTPLRTEYPLPEISEWMTISHDARDTKILNTYAEAWLATATPETRSESLSILRRALDDGKLPEARTLTGTSVEFLGAELLEEVDGLARSRRGAAMLELATTREQVQLALDGIAAGLPDRLDGPAGSLLEDVRATVARNIERNQGRSTTEEVARWHARGYDTHVDFGELGRIEANVRLLEQLTQPRATPSVAPPAHPGLTW